MGRILIVSYSMTGTTWKAAGQLAQFCDADRDTIRPWTDLSGIARTVWALWGALMRTEPDIEPPRHDPSDYELVVLATPVWAARMAAPMRSYIMAERGRFSRVAFLCTQGGAGADRVSSSMSDLCGQHPVAVLALSAGDFARGTAQTLLRDFGRDLMEALPNTPPSRQVLAAANR